MQQQVVNFKKNETIYLIMLSRTLCCVIKKVPPVYCQTAYKLSEKRKFTQHNIRRKCYALVMNLNHGSVKKFIKVLK